MILMALAKFLSITGTALKSNVTTLKKPYKLNFSITYLCQSRCLTCNIWKMKPVNELRLEEITEFARKNNYFKWVELTGGEPFLRSDIVEIAKTFKENFKSLYVLTIPTNSLCSPSMLEQRIKQILELNIPKVAITVSLDGYKELHDRIRGIPGNYEKAINIFKMLKALKKQYSNLHAMFGYTISSFNPSQFEATFEAVKHEIPDITYNDFHINLAQESENYYDNKDLQLKPTTEAPAEIAHILKNRQQKLNPIDMIEATFLKNLVYYAKTGKSPMKSRSLEASLFLDSYGNVFPSIAWNEKIGNIRDAGYDLSLLWNNEKAIHVRRLSTERKDPVQWTSCEAFQSITGNIKSML